MGLFDFLKPKTKSPDMTLRVTGNIFEPESLISALDTRIPEYLAAVNQGRCKSPACTRKSGEPYSSVSDIWEDTRLEAFVPLFRHGASNPMALCQVPMQRELFTRFNNDHPHLKLPHVPSGEELHDTIQAVWQCVLYLREQCSKAGTNLTVRDTALEVFNSKCVRAYEWWQNEENGSAAYALLARGERPPLMFYILWTEATRLAKEVAIASIFGSSLKFFMDLMVKTEKRTEVVDAYRTMITRLSTANDPHELKRTA